MYYKECVLNSRVLAPLSRLALIIEACCVLQGISKNSESRVLAPPSRLALITRAWFVLQGISKSLSLRLLAPPSRSALIDGAGFVLQGMRFEFACVGSAVEIGFDYRGLHCITKDF